MDGIGVDRAVLVGHDLGGGVAQILAVSARHRCAGLVLVNSISYDSWPTPSVKTTRTIGGLVERPPSAMFRTAVAAFIRVGHDDRAMGRESARIHAGRYAERRGPRAFVRQIRSLTTEDTLAVSDRPKLAGRHG